MKRFTLLCLFALPLAAQISDPSKWKNNSDGTISPKNSKSVKIDTTLSTDQATPDRHATKTTYYTKSGKVCALPSTADGGAETCTEAAYTLPASIAARPCEVVWGTRASTATALADDDDVVSACTNLTGAAMTATLVSCTSWGGQATVLPKLTGGADLLGEALTCGADGTFADSAAISVAQADGASLDLNVSAANSATYIVLRIKRSL